MAQNGAECAHSAGGCGGRHIRRSTAMSGSFFCGLPGGVDSHWQEVFLLQLGLQSGVKLCGCCSSSPLPDETSMRWLLGYGTCANGGTPVLN